jgi:integrase/recombinase XerD
MTATTVVQSKRKLGRSAGLLDDYLGIFSADLCAQRYAPDTIRHYVASAKMFARWLSRQQLEVDDIDEALVQRYVASLKRRLDRSKKKRRLPHTGVGLTHLVRSLRQQGALPLHCDAPPSTDAERWLQGYAYYLDRTLGCAPATRYKYLYFAKQFLAFYCESDCLDWQLLQAAHLTEFVQREAAQRTGFGRKSPAVAMRVMVRYLINQGETRSGIEAAIPTIRQWKHAALPQSLTAADIERVLAACANDTLLERRNYTILLMLARLGIRAKEVAELTLDDIDWVEGCLVIRSSKTHCNRSLPLPQDVGDALIAYLKHGRPNATQRAVFLTHHAPFNPLQTATAITHIAQQCLANAGIPVSPGHGAHLFRHAAATRMVQGGASFKQIADVLGHQTLQTTAIYAKLNLAALSQVALPWPGGAQ